MSVSQSLNIPAARIPRHIAIIMDGNGRWAVRQGSDRTTGHQQGARVVKSIVTECSRLRDELGGPNFLTLYSFSIENWKRPIEEVAFLMRMYIDYLREERKTMMQNNIRFHQIGRLDNLPDEVMDEVNETLELTRNNTGLNLVLALNYGSRAEITDAVRSIAAKVKAGELDPQDVTEKTISDHLYTAGWPDPDLLIRTAGENGQPEFGVPELHKALNAFARRNRRFGALDHTNTLQGV